MLQAVEKYAQMMHRLEIAPDVLKHTADIFEAVPQILNDLSNPAVALEKKHRVIDKVFPKEIRDLLKLLCDDDKISMFTEICEAYRTQMPRKKETVRAILRYVTKPDEKQLEGIRRFLRTKYEAQELDLTMVQDASLGGGFVLEADGEEFDWSQKGRARQMREKLEKSVSAEAQSLEGIISILKSEIENFDLEAKEKEVGVVSWVGDGIANIDGIDHAMYGEIVVFDNGIKGMVQDIRRDEVACILFGRDTGIREGTRVMRTGKKAGIPVGEAFLGRVADPLGAPIDGKGEIHADSYLPMEEEAPGIVERKSVSVPLETGILAIDSMFPIGRGQRELIIGDRQTGKTSIALDTILNQKGKNVICIYTAIGQKASTVAKIVNTLKKHEALEYTIIVAATASDPAPLQYIAPYSATALAEYFMHQGKDVLIVYDDLSKHAVAYRALSLLLERSPRLNEEAGGGSITALPIIETQAGDVSAYIPTNVISITDGQIFLESDLFFAGMRPAVNVGLSVSRVGGAAQTKAMKKAAGSIRIDLAQYREMEVFTQFSSDLDASTKELLQYGRGLMELLKQPLGEPLSMEEQVITLCAVTGRLLLSVPLEQMKTVQREMLAWFRETQPDIMNELATRRDLDESLKDRIHNAVRSFLDARRK